MLRSLILSLTLRFAASDFIITYMCVSILTAQRTVFFFFVFFFTLQDTTGALAAMVDPREHSPAELQTPYSSFLTQTDVLVGEVIDVTSRHVIVSRFDCGDAAETVVCLPYNILVICTGMRSSFVDIHSTTPTTIGSKSRLRTFISFSERIRNSKSIAVVGGRLVGTELAGRIAAFFQKKKGSRGGEPHTITLIEKEPEILPGFPEEAVNYARKRLDDAGVKIMTSREALFPSDTQHSVTSGPLRVRVLSEDSVPSEKKRKWGLSSSKDDKNKAPAPAPVVDQTPKKKKPVEEYSFDLIIDCTGGKPNTSFLKDQFGDALDIDGFVKVRSTMQVHKHPFVFAAGDIVAMMDEHTAITALQQASVVSKNVAVMALMGLQSSSSLGSIGKLRAAFVPKEEPYIHFVAHVLNDKDGFIIESNSFSSSGSKIGAFKRKNETSAIKFAQKKKECSMLDDTASQERAPRYNFSIRRFFSQDTDPTLSPKTPPSSPVSPQAQIIHEVAILRFCDSPLCKHLAYAMMRRGFQIHPFVRVDQIHEATALLRDAPIPVTITAEMSDRSNFSALLSSAKCVILPIWPSTDDDDMASSMVRDCKAVANAVISAHVPQVIVVSPKTRHALNGCRGTPIADCCISCVFEECVQAFREAIPKRLTVIYVEPEMRNPVLMQTLQAIQLNRVTPLPLGVPGKNELYMSFLAPDDATEAIFEVFQHPSLYKGKQYHLTGKKAMTGVKIANAISRSIDEAVSYECVSPQQTFLDLTIARVPRSIALLYATCTGTTKREECVTHDLSTILGPDYRQLSFERWAKQKRALFLSGAALDDIDLDDVLKKPEAVRELISSVVSGKRIVHTEISENELTLEEVIGRGACAVVYKAQYRGTTVAVKKFKASVVEFEPQVFRQEVAIISILRHPDLVSCIGACTHNKESLSIVVEYMPQGSLDSYIRSSDPPGPFPLQRQFQFAGDIARAMKFLHGIGLIHGDLKPANLLVTDNLQIKLTDFDTCKFLSPKMKSQLGTPDFIPPESFKEKGYTQMVDVYAYGITLWEIVTRKQPYADIDVFDIPERVSDGLRPEPVPAHPLYGMMQNCWQEKPNKRPTFVSILDSLETIAMNQGITLHEHSLHSSNAVAGFGGGGFSSQTKFRSKSAASSPTSGVIVPSSSSTRVRRTASASPPKDDSPKEPLDGSPSSLTAGSNACSNNAVQKQSAKPPQERRLVHRQSTPNMRRLDSTSLKSPSMTASGPNKATPSVTSPESGSAGNASPRAEVSSSENSPCSQSVPSSLDGSPKFEITPSVSMDAATVEHHSLTVAESSHSRTRTLQYRVSSFRELSLDTSARTSSGAAEAQISHTSEFLLVPVEDNSIVSEEKVSPSPSRERRKHHHKENPGGSSSGLLLSYTSHQAIRVRPPPVSTPSRDGVHGGGSHSFD